MTEQKLTGEPYHTCNMTSCASGLVKMGSPIGLTPPGHSLDSDQSPIRQKFQMTGEPCHWLIPITWLFWTSALSHMVSLCCCYQSKSLPVLYFPCSEGQRKSLNNQLHLIDIETGLDMSCTWIWTVSWLDLKWTRRVYWFNFVCKWVLYPWSDIG